MPWFPVDDTFHSHPKRLATSAAALGLWVVAGSWSNAYLTDGRIPDHVLPLLLPDAATLADELVATGLWKRTRGGYVFNDWLEWGNKRTADQVRQLRSKRAEAGRQGGVASGQARKSKAKVKREANTEANHTVDNSQGNHEHDTANGLTSQNTRSNHEANASAVGSRIVEPPVPTNTSTGSYQRAGPRYPHAAKPGFFDSNGQNGAAARSPSSRTPAQAIAEALHPEDP